jgi:tetratricopeptide (TPR) repeat protein
MAEAIADRIRMAVAAELAAAGAYLRAESMLIGPWGSRRSPHELDLLARIYVQQERYSEARASWQEALSADPDNEEYQDALASLREHQERLQMRNRITMGLYVFMAFMGIAALLLLLVFRFAA